MSRVLSVAASKGKSVLGRSLPKEGTKIRDLYDRFFLSRGSAINFSLSSDSSYSIERLKNEFGCDIRWCGRGKYLLAGEEIDGTYVDYVAERLFHALPPR